MDWFQLNITKENIKLYLFTGACSSGNSENYDCLFKAVENATGKKISREEVAEHLVKDKQIRMYIEMGIHEHYIDMGKIGGANRRDKKEKHLKNMVEILKNERDYEKAYKEWKEYVTEEKITNSKKIKRNSKDSKACKETKISLCNKFRDYPYAEDGRQKKTGNDELWQVNEAAIREAHKLHWEYKDKNPNENKDNYSHLDIMLELRVDTQYVIFNTEKIPDYKPQENDPPVSGHPGALYKNKEFGEKNRICKGSSKFHEFRFSKMKEENSPTNIAVAGLMKHLELTICPKDLRDMKDLPDTYTTSGQNLKDSKQREIWLKGYERERLKIYYVAEALNGGSLDIEKPSCHLDDKNDEYIKEVKASIAEVVKGTEHGSTKQLEGIGKILRNPAPFYRRDRKII